MITGAQVEIRSGAWACDSRLMLDFPDNWDVKALWPRTPAPLSRDEIWNALENPIGQQPIRQLAYGRRRPVIVVDDLNRPTPAWQIVPLVLKQFAQAKIDPRDVTVVMAPGTHGAPPGDALERKIGREAASVCHALVHDHARDGVRAGKTSFGTPVFVNREVLKGDFVVGIGGVFPNHTAGFGGGSKLALGVLCTPSIRHLHYSHQPSGWGKEHEINFRKDLDEIARMIGMHSIVSVHINSDCDTVGLHYGDQNKYFCRAVEFAKQICSVPRPGDADVVIVNTYPVDLYLTFARMKGFAALSLVKPSASKIAIASCAEGLGHHGLFPLQPSRLHRLGEIAAQLRTLKFIDLKRKANQRLADIAGSHNGRQPSRPAVTPVPKRPIWVYRPGEHSTVLPAECLDMKIRNSWAEIIAAVQQEQGNRDLKVILYACSPLQCFAV